MPKQAPLGDVRVQIEGAPGNAQMKSFQFEIPRFPEEAEELRLEVRAFLARERAADRFIPHRSSWSSFDPDFSRRAAEAGYVGMTLPKAYGAANVQASSASS